MIMLLVRSFSVLAAKSGASSSLLRATKPITSLAQRATYSDDFRGHASAGTKYGRDGVANYANRPSHGVLGKIYVDPLIDEFLKSEVPGKKVVDIGCGLGDWSLKAAQFGAKSVDGFDYEEEMVKVAKKTTSQCDNVRICVGNAANMPYSDNEFDVAISFVVTNNLSMESFSKHFEELFRVLVPGGKSMVVFPLDPVCKLVTVQGVDSDATRPKLDTALGSLPNFPTSKQIMEAVNDFNGVILAIFKRDVNGQYSVVKDASELHNGQPVWVKAENVIIPNFYYNRSYYDKCIAAAGLCLKKSEHGFTDERREAYNRDKKPEEQSHYIFPAPLAIHYHLTKPQ